MFHSASVCWQCGRGLGGSSSHLGWIHSRVCRQLQGRRGLASPAWQAVGWQVSAPRSLLFSSGPAWLRLCRGPAGGSVHGLQCLGPGSAVCHLPFILLPEASLNNSPPSRSGQGAATFLGEASQFRDEGRDPGGDWRTVLRSTAEPFPGRAGAAESGRSATLSPRAGAVRGRGNGVGWLSSAQFPHHFTEGENN